ncbi:hypothetical protein URH17368_1811 [Alicyclobacillus hesperidum URH17-3-68]|nr:hypothetical protein URH17368_1811 [Alicyclobacillus hesperidum URH17-3-68]
MAHTQMTNLQIRAIGEDFEHHGQVVVQMVRNGNLAGGRV